MIWLAVALAGGAGAVVRLYIGELTARVTGLGTFLVNTTACAAAGFATTLAHDARLVVAGGFLGALSTFSTWVVEAERASVRFGALLLAGGLAAGLAAAAIGS